METEDLFQSVYRNKQLHRPKLAGARQELRDQLRHLQVDLQDAARLQGALHEPHRRAPLRLPLLQGTMHYQIIKVLKS